MAFIEPAHVNDIGTIFRVTVFAATSTGTSTVADISTASTKQIVFSRPDGTTLTKTAVFTTDGEDGDIQYLSVDGDLNMAGTWHLQVYIVTPAGEWRTDVGHFRVYENL